METRGLTLAPHFRHFAVLLTTAAALIFNMNHHSSAATITVTNTADSGPGTLRAALASAANRDTVKFSLPTPATITLTSGELLISKNVSIMGPGANNLAVAADRPQCAGWPPCEFRVFHIASNSFVNISSLTITNGYATFNSGGGIFNHHATLTVSNCTLSGNFATHFGGAIMNLRGSVAIWNSTLSGNVGGGTGGAIYNRGQASGAATLIVGNSTLSRNLAGVTFGGVANFADSGAASVQILNSTVSGNVAGDTGNGGDIGSWSWSGGSATLQIVNSTLSLSSGIEYGSLDGGGNAEVQIGSTILDGASLDGTFIGQLGAFISLGHNLSSDGGGGFLTNATDQINTDPMLGRLQDNGGPTFTHALLPGSLAIDNGKNLSAAPADQRGCARTIDNVIGNAPGGDGTDIGAVEMATPFLSNFGIISNEFRFNLIGISNQVVVLEASTNLANWTPLTTHTLGVAPIYFRDSIPANLPQRFYRARLP